MSDEKGCTTERLLEAYAKSLAVYYAAEKAFQAAPTTVTVQEYHIAVDRFQHLRREVVRTIQFGTALSGTEENGIVGL